MPDQTPNAPTGDGVVLRPMTPADLPFAQALTDLLRWPHRLADWAQVFAHAEGIVAERDGEIVGWASLSRFHVRAAYGKTVENSLYVHPDHHRQGIGWALLTDLASRARALDYHTIIAGIDAEQTPSVALHVKAGFTHAGHLKQVGFKFNRWLDVIYMQLML